MARPIEASNGVAVSVDGSYADVGPMPEIIVCSGLDVQKYDHGPLIAKLRKLAFYGVSIGAVCTGTYILAKAGLLDGHRCAIHWENFDSFREEFPEIEATQELFEIDRNRFTCAGGTASIDMMLALITAKKGAVIAALVTDELIHHRMRDSHERQRMELRARLGVSHPKLLAVIGEMDKRLERPVSCAQLATHGAPVAAPARAAVPALSRYHADALLPRDAPQPGAPAPAPDLDADPLGGARLRLRLGLAFLQVLFGAFRPHALGGAQGHAHRAQHRDDGGVTKVTQRRDLTIRLGRQRHGRSGPVVVS